jgi:glutamate dehydrogenase (NAD(P)+)
MSITFDDIGPERIHHFYDPASGMRAALVIDTTLFRFSGGGVRMLPDISLEEVASLARAMTYKFAWLDVPVAGAKAGVWFDPASQDRDAVLEAFGRAAAPLLQTRAYMCGADMGTDHHDVRRIRAAAGLPEEKTPLAIKQVEGLALEELVTGYGVIRAARTALELRGRGLADATLAVEGFGKVGAGCVRQGQREGARVVAVSTLKGARYDASGLDVDRLIALRHEVGDDAVLEYEGGELLAREALFGLPVDVLVPGARVGTIDAHVAPKVQAALIAPAGNAPVTPEADAMLHRRGITVVPDFIANAGGVLLEVADARGGSEADAFATTGERIAANTERVLEEAERRGQTPLQAGIAIAREWLADMKAADRRAPEELLQSEEGGSP